MMSLLREIYQRRELLYNLTVRELKIRYRGSVLGFLWTLLIPLFMALIYVVFLRMLAGRGVPMTEIIIGVFAWQFTVQSVNSGLHSITGNANLVKKVFIPRIILPLASTLANLVNYLLSLIVQIPLIAVLQSMQGGGLSGWLVLMPVMILVHFLFNLALALLLAGSNVYFRDLEHLVGVGLSAWFFMSPVMYNLSFVQRLAADIPWAMSAYLLNPLAGIVTAYRSLALPELDMVWTLPVAISLVFVLFLFFFSVRLFMRLQRNFADLL
ncbi:MAG TPA: ABC transporter permease [Kiritimatiellia bacterium]|nr:ABC transporter permease [Kiritimatiellia bacterium]